jgi:hypothetical protein
MWAEDMSRIHTLCITAHLSNRATAAAAAPKQVITRAMAWATAVPARELAAASTAQQHALRVFVEVDVVAVLALTDTDGSAAAGVRTICGILEISDSMFVHASVDLHRASALIDQQGRLQCRFPYNVHTAGPSESENRDGFHHLAAALQASPDASLLLSCQLCGADVLETRNDVRTCRPLPSGLLDNVSTAGYTIVVVSGQSLC